MSITPVNRARLLDCDGHGAGRKNVGVALCEGIEHVAEVALPIGTEVFEPHPARCNMRRSVFANFYDAHRDHQ